MSGFSPDWLALREPADHRARDSGIAAMVEARFATRGSVAVIDVGCGTGSNLRATSQLLPDRQSWTLVDYDRGLLASARSALARWADGVEIADHGLALVKGRRRIAVTFRHADLAADLEAALAGDADLVTASALFDLCSGPFIRRFAQAVARKRAAFLTVLTYNGIQRFTPRHPLDQGIAQAFNAHQMRDKGFGPSAGPTAPAELADAFRAVGYLVSEGDSPWQLTVATDGALLSELTTGKVAAVAETGMLDATALAVWSAIRHTGAEVGHTDTFAVPGDPGAAFTDDGE
jgi:SAM-dependent methyltransferase